MTELDIRSSDNTPALPANHVPVTTARSLPAGSASLVEWAQQADIAYQMANKLASTSFVPQSLRGKPGDIAAAILAGQELGLKPMATLKSIDVIQGTPALRAHAMRGILQNHGHEIELVESDNEHCVMRGRRKGSESWQTVTWTIQRAALLGLVGKAEWKKQPGTMLIARATGEICRLVASDALHGMPYAAEELTDSAPITITRIQAAPLSVAAITAGPAAPVAQPVAAPAPAPAEDENLPHEWDIYDLAKALDMDNAALEERCHGVTGGSISEATEAQLGALFQELANEVVAQDNRRSAQ